MSVDDQVLARLATTRNTNGTPFLQAHHLAAATRLERLIARASIVPRVTMSYNPAAVSRRSQGVNAAEDLTDSAAAARRSLNRLASTLPADCWGVLFDVCAFGKGLQGIETERQWPRRSAKLVLRIGLDQLAAVFGLTPHVAGSDGRQTRSWLDERLPLIANHPS